VTVRLDSAFTTTSLNGSSITMGKSSTGDPFQVTEKSESAYQISLSIDNVNTTGLGINTLDISTMSGAATALGNVDTAISNLSSYRGNLGAVQNRLGYAAANLSISIENTVASESIIRDVDMAAEMTTFTKNQILMQAGTAMLAQANMAPQSILQLLK
jgi:flagellin